MEMNKAECPTLIEYVSDLGGGGGGSNLGDGTHALPPSCTKHRVGLGISDDEARITKSTSTRSQVVIMTPARTEDTSTRLKFTRSRPIRVTRMKSYGPTHKMADEMRLKKGTL